MGLVYVVVGVLAEDDDLDCVERGVTGPGKSLRLEKDDFC